MKRIIVKSLPKGFRHFLSKKDIKKLEENINLKFFHIGFGHQLQTAKFNQQDELHSSVHLISLWGSKTETGWQIDIHQIGFREELLPEKFEEQVKQEIEVIIKDYLYRLMKSRETDFINRPQLWINVSIINEQAVVNTKELT